MSKWQTWLADYSDVKIKSDVYQKVFSMELIEVFHHLLSAAWVG